MKRELENTGPQSYGVHGGRRPWPELIEGPSRKAVLKEVGRAVAAGELAASGPLEATAKGRYQVAVWRIKERTVAPRRWVKPVVVAGGVVLSLGILALVGWWLAGAVTVALGAVSVPLVVGAAVAAWLMWLAIRRGDGGGCETTITIRHRHR